MDAEKLRREILARADAVRDPLYVALAHSGETEEDRIAIQRDVGSFRIYYDIPLCF